MKIIIINNNNSNNKILQNKLTLFKITFLYNKANFVDLIILFIYLYIFLVFIFLIFWKMSSRLH